MIKEVKGFWKRMFRGYYDAAEGSSRRRDAGSFIRSPDYSLREPRRRRIIENARDLSRNFSVAAWAMRRHLDYVTDFTFRMQTDDTNLNKDIEGYMDWWSLPQNCDAAMRHTFPSMIRLMELQRTLAGDGFLAKLNSGRLQGIESDRVRTEGDLTGYTLDEDPRKKIIHGVKVDDALRALSYMLWRRTENGQYEFVREVPAQFMLPLGYYTMFDQIRGVSPLSTAINSYKDLYEGFEYALGKMKVTQLFGLVFYREMTDSDETFLPEVDEVSNVPGDTGAKYEVDFGRGPVKLELDPGDRAEFLESKSPSSELQDFSQIMIAVALKALDIPMSFYDESFTNFYGSRAAAMGYNRACRSKRNDIKNLLNRITRWQLSIAIRDGRIQIPSGMTVNDLKWDWIHAGMPWWRPLEEVRADIEAIKAGFKTHDMVTRERYAKSFPDMIDDISAEQEYANAQGVTLVTQVDAPQATNTIPGEE